MTASERRLNPLAICFLPKLASRVWGWDEACRAFADVEKEREVRAANERDDVAENRASVEAITTV